MREKSSSPLGRPQRLINALIAELQKVESRRLTDRELARYLDVQPATVSKWRNGGTKLEQVEWLLRLLEALPEDRRLAELNAVLLDRGEHANQSG